MEMGKSAMWMHASKIVPPSSPPPLQALLPVSLPLSVEQGIRQMTATVGGSLFSPWTQNYCVNLTMVPQ